MAGAQRAGLHELPVLIREVSDAAALEIALVENIQRGDLMRWRRRRPRPADRAIRLHPAATGGRRRQEPQPYRQHAAPAAAAGVGAGAARAGAAHRRPCPDAFVAAADAEALADRIVKFGLSVREAEALARQPRQERAAGREQGEKDPNVQALESALSEALGLAIEVDDRGKAGAGW